MPLPARLTTGSAIAAIATHLLRAPRWMGARPAVLLGTVLALVGLAVGCEPTNQGYAPTQPIAYSHKVHAGDNEIPCLYCHFGAERSRFAGIPPARVCINCHVEIKRDAPVIEALRAQVKRGEPIVWERVHRLPDHAYFNHRAHVVGAQLACQTCHGPVETMEVMRQWAPLTMGWCVDCHRLRAAGLAAPPAPETPAASRAASHDAEGAPREAALNPLIDCSTCHH